MECCIVAIVIIIFVVVIFLSASEGGTNEIVNSNNLQKSREPVKPLDSKVIETEMFLVKTAVLMGTANSGISAEANVFAFENKGRVSHRMFFTLNKRVPLTINLKKLVEQTRNSDNQVIKEVAIKKLMEYMDIKITPDSISRFTKYIGMVKFENTHHDEYMIQFVASYGQEVPVELVDNYRREIYKRFREEMEFLSGISEIKEKSMGIEINIKPKALR